MPIVYQINLSTEDYSWYVRVCHRGAALNLSEHEVDMFFSIVPALYGVSYKLNTDDWRHGVYISMKSDAAIRYEKGILDGN